jgi:hypothetical protein
MKDKKTIKRVELDAEEIQWLITRINFAWNLEGGLSPETYNKLMGRLIEARDR